MRASEQCTGPFIDTLIPRFRGDFSQGEKKVNSLARGSDEDGLHDAVEVVHDLARGYAQSKNALARHPGVAPRVVQGLVAKSVTFAIDLDRQVRAGAVEIEDVGTQRMLTAELQASLARVSQNQPQMHFRRRHGFAQSTRPGQCQFSRFHSGAVA